MTSTSHKEKNNKINNIKRKIHQTLIKKYEKLSLKYNTNIIDNIIYNERTHIVAEFKDKLIIDDNGEFFKRYYKFHESIIRLPKFYEYYELYSKIFPNYTSLPEGKYFYRNIQKKQKMIDIQEQIEFENLKKKNKNRKSKINISDQNSSYNNKNSDSKSHVFSTDIINSILNETDKDEFELLFNVNKENRVKEEEIFSDKISEIVKTIDKYKIDKINKKNYNKKKHGNSNSSKKKGLKNKNGSHSGNKNKVNNTVLGNEILNSKFAKLNLFNKSTIRKNTIFHLNDKKINININKFNKNDKNFIKIIEQNIFKKKKLISKLHNKNFLHNISSSTSIKKELSKSKRNSSNISKNKKPSASTSSYNIINNKNISFPHRMKHYNRINSNINHKKIEILMKNSLKFPNPPMTGRSWKKGLNFSLDKKIIHKPRKIIQTKYTYSNNNIHNSKKHKKSFSNEDLTRRKKHNILNLNQFNKNSLNNLNIKKKINNTNTIKNINKRKFFKNNNFSNIINKTKYKNCTYYLIDSRNYFLNDFFYSYRNRKTNSTKKNSINSKSNSSYNMSKSPSKSKSKKKNNSKNYLIEGNNNILFKQKTKERNFNNKNLKQIKNNKKNILHKLNWKIDSRNKKPLFISNNISKCKTKNILNPNDSCIKKSILGMINSKKKSNQKKNIQNYSKIFKYMSNKNLGFKTQRNYSFNNIN